jgi:D-3-phosphoglycerate dehydrogenase
VKAIITAPFHQEGVDILSKHMDVQLAGWGQTQEELTEDQLIEAAQGCEVLISEVEEITARVIDSLPDLKLIGCTRANPSDCRRRRSDAQGYSRIPCPGAKRSISCRANSAAHDRRGPKGFRG